MSEIFLCLTPCFSDLVFYRQGAPATGCLWWELAGLVIPLPFLFFGKQRQICTIWRKNEFAQGGQDGHNISVPLRPILSWVQTHGNHFVWQIWIELIISWLCFWKEYIPITFMCSQIFCNSKEQMSDTKIFPERLLPTICLFNVKRDDWWKRFQKIYPDLTGFPLSRPILIVLRSLWKIAGREDWKKNQLVKENTCLRKDEKNCKFSFQSRKVCGRTALKQLVAVMKTKTCALYVQPKKADHNFCT